MTNVKELTLSDLTGKPVDSKSIVDRAFHFAFISHKDQTRSNGEEFIVHPLRVAMILKNEMYVEEQNTLAAALLHDTLEDQPKVTFEQLVREFGSYVAEAVKTLTKPKQYIETKDPALLQAYFHDILTHRILDIRRIKVADRIDNLRDFGDWKKDRRERYINESKRFVLPIAQSIGTREELLLSRQILFSETL